MTSLLTLDGVCRSYVGRAETVDAVVDATAVVDAGEMVALAGPSGSGKSTLLHLILGWETPDAGTVAVAAEVSERLGWAGVAVVPQELGLIPELTGAQNVSLAARLAGVEAASLALLFESLAIGHLVDRLPHELSLGEQQRFAVARAVSASPTLLIADEPTAHQDEQNGARVMSVLSSVASAGGAVLVATHDQRALDVTDRVLRMSDGHLA